MYEIPVRAEAQSEILRATQILFLHVQSSICGEWQPVSGKMQERIVEVKFELIRLLKGRTDEPPGQTIALAVRQTEAIGPRFFAVPGIWSNKDLDEGRQFVVFCVSNSTAAGQILEEPNCRKVEAAETALPDIELVLEAGAPNLPLVEFLVRLFDKRASYGSLFSQYVVDRLPEVLFHKVDDFDQVMALVEDSRLAPVSRSILLSGIYSRFLLLDPAPDAFVARLVTGTCRVLTLPQAAALHENLLQTYMPNLLGLEGGATRKSAGDIFAGKLEQRRECEVVLHGYPNRSAARIVLEWIRS